MKRYGDLYRKIILWDNLVLAEKNASKDKRHYKEIQEYHKHLYDNLEALRYDLENTEYTMLPYKIKIKNDGVKTRKIYISRYRDRIVQWAIIQVLGSIIEKKFIKTTYSAIKGRGIHKCLRDVEWAVYNHPDKCKYCLKMDVHHYYPSINHDVLWDQLTSFIKDGFLMNILAVIIMSVPYNEGVPIGNFLSQYLGNLYLTPFDHWVKEELHVKYYFRYMDDLVIFGETKEELHEIRKKVQEKLKNEFYLELKSNYQVFPTFVRGLDFVGYRIFRDKVVLRERTARHLKKKMLRAYRKGVASAHDYASAQSYKGWLKWANCFYLYRKYILPITEGVRKYDELWRNFRHKQTRAYYC